MLKALQVSARTLGILISLGGSLLISPGAAAALQASLPPAVQVVAGDGVSLQQAASRARKQHGGKVVKAETVTLQGREVHQIRLVNGGRVSTVIIDAASGQEITR